MPETQDTRMHNCVYENCPCETSKDRNREKKLAVLGEYEAVICVCVYLRLVAN